MCSLISFNRARTDAVLPWLLQGRETKSFSIGPLSQIGLLMECGGEGGNVGLHMRAVKANPCARSAWWTSLVVRRAMVLEVRRMASRCSVMLGPPRVFAG